MSLLNREASSLTQVGVLLPQVADSKFLENIGLHERQLDLGHTSVNITAINPINTATTISQTWHSNRENQGYDVGQIKIPVYSINAHYEYNAHEAAVFEKNVAGLSLASLMSSLCIQGINQRLRQAVYHGLSLNEGLLANASVFTFGSDKNSKDKLVEMDTGFVLHKLMNMINEIMGATLNRGSKLVITSSVRVINYLNTTIVPLINYQQKGAGTGSIGSTLKDVIKSAYDIECEIIADATFESDKDDSGDVIAMVIPTLKNDTEGSYDVNYAGGLNSIAHNTYINMMDSVRASTNQELNGFLSGNYDLRTTPGAVLRKECVLTTTIKYH